MKAEDMKALCLLIRENGLEESYPALLKELDASLAAGADTPGLADAIKAAEDACRKDLEKSETLLKAQQEERLLLQQERALLQAEYMGALKAIEVLRQGEKTGYPFYCM